ncbi:hypothetical protein FRB94_010495 [Tulasnella sp. JGI-2019a]|nr:hypothetical protein FRB94_010495 [Tulasnella sp. JGI-2019a]KAG9033054.1 hypothetical protein FRB95_000639 [Tulasnella sp. JGI-2019a]
MIQGIGDNRTEDDKFRALLYGRFGEHQSSGVPGLSAGYSHNRIPSISARVVNFGSPSFLDLSIMDSPLRTAMNQQSLGSANEATAFNPYQPYSQPAQTNGSGPSKFSYSEPAPERYQSGPGQPAASERKWPLSNVYWSISGIMGFREKWSLLLFFIFGGALSAYCLARAEFFNWNRLQDLMSTGEWYLYRPEPYKGALIFHIYSSIFAGFWAPWQFIPAIRRQKMHLHRLNGYLTLILLIPSTVAGAVIARRAFGGAVDIQAANYAQGILIVFAAIKGYSHVKTNTRKHRKWMLRTVAYLAASVTAKLTKLIASKIVSDVGSYYTIWTCAEVQFLQSIGKGVPDFAAAYPSCNTDGDLSKIHLAIHASTVETPVNEGSAIREVSAMVLFVALLIHSLGIEIYIRASESRNQERHGFVLEPRGIDGKPEEHP